MKRTFKKIATTSFFSLALVAGTITGYNAMHVADYTSQYKEAQDIKAKWISETNNKEKLEQQYNHFSYTQEQFLKDKTFFNEIFSQKDFYIPNLEKTYFYTSDYSFLKYIKIYNYYEGNTDWIKEQKEINKQYANKHLSKKEYNTKMGTDFLKYNKNYERILAKDSVLLYNFQPPYDNDRTAAFNHILVSKRLPPFLFNDVEMTTLDNGERVEGEDQMFKVNPERKKLFDDFLIKMQKGKIDEKKQYEFMKMVNFINSKLNEKMEATLLDSTLYPLLQRNTYAAKEISLLKLKTKYYQDIDNEKADKYELFGNSRDLLGTYMWKGDR